MEHQPYIRTEFVKVAGVVYEVSPAGWAEFVESSLNWPPMPSLLTRRQSGHWCNVSGFPVRRKIYAAIEAAYQRLITQDVA